MTAISLETALPNTYANSHKQPLVAHSVLIGLYAKALFLHLYPGAPPVYADAAFYAGLFHDIGKLDPTFQTYLQKPAGVTTIDDSDGAHIQTKKETDPHSFANHPRHNEISWALLRTWFNKPALAKYIHHADALLAIDYAVYWHHARPLRKDQESFFKLSVLQEKTMDWSMNSSMQAILREFLQGVDAFLGSNLTELLLDHPLKDSNTVPSFKEKYQEKYSELHRLSAAWRESALDTMVRACVVESDWTISALSADKMWQWLQLYKEVGPQAFPLKAHTDPVKGRALAATIQQMVQHYDDLGQHNTASQHRNQAQKHAAESLPAFDLGVLQGPAGCGKTKIMLQWMARNPLRKTFIFVPRIAIGQGLYKELSQALQNGGYGLDDSLEIMAGDLRLRMVNGVEENTPEGEELRSHVVITTIDQLSNLQLKHTKTALLNMVMSSNAVFDEFHELMDIPGILMMAMELFVMRSYLSTGQAEASCGGTLLMSATPNPFYLECMNMAMGTRDGVRPLTDSKSKQVVKVASFNTKPYTLMHQTYKDGNPYVDNPHIKAGHFVVGNRISAVQQAAKYAIDQNTDVLCAHSALTPRHRKDVFTKLMNTFGKHAAAPTTVLFAGPIVQASLNISTSCMHTHATTAENLIQRLGRVNRFGYLPCAELQVYSENGKVESTLRRMYQNHRAQTFLDFLVARNVFNGQPYTIQDIYGLYTQYHNQESTKKAYADDMLALCEESIKIFKKHGFDPVQYPKPKAKDTKTPMKMAARSLRGSSYYTLPMFYRIRADGTYCKQWLFSTSSAADDMLTDDNNELLFMGDNERSQFLEYLKSSQSKAMVWTSKLPMALSKLAKRKGLNAIHLREMARSHETPFVVTFEGASQQQKYANRQKVYVEYHGVMLGLMPLDLLS